MFGNALPRSALAEDLELFEVGRLSLQMGWTCRRNATEGLPPP